MDNRSDNGKKVKITIKRRLLGLLCAFGAAFPVFVFTSFGTLFSCSGNSCDGIERLFSALFLPLAIGITVYFIVVKPLKKETPAKNEFGKN